MSSTSQSDPPPAGEAWLKRERIVRRFEDAWRRGERPDLEAFLPSENPLRKAVLVELVSTDLELRLAADEVVAVEHYLTRFPVLAAEPEAVLELIGVEINHRRRQGALTLEDYRRRFPQLEGLLTLALGNQATEPSAAARPRPRPLPAIPGYEVIEEIGRGGMGVVYKARQVGLRRMVALKMILAGVHAGAEEHARFQTEAEAIARLSHPNIVQVHEVGEHDGVPYFALEYLDGGSLTRRLDHTPLPPGEAAELLRALAGAVAYAHSRGVLHRDLKPDNVLLSFSREPPASAQPALAGGSRLNEYVPKIVDFGLAKQLAPEGSAATAHTQTGAVLGTPSYMAPEQARGQGRDVGPAADVWALGAILYECLTGRPPFKAATVLETLQQVCGHEPAAPRALQPACPRDLETISQKCLQKEPARRYPDARALEEDPRRWLAGEPIVARPVGLAERAVKWVRRRPVVAGLLVAIVASVGLAFAAVKSEQLRTAKQRDLAEENLHRAQLAEKQAKKNLEYASQAVEECFGIAKDDPLLKADQLRKVRLLLFQKTLPFYQRFTEDSPDDPGLTAQHAYYLYRVASITEEIGNKADALKTYERALAFQVALAEAHPEVAEHQARLAMTNANLGKLQSLMGNRQEALRSFEQAREGQTRLTKAYPHIGEYQAELARTWNNLGVLLKETGKEQLALKSFAQARDIQAGLREAHPLVPDYQAALAVTFNNLGSLQRQMGRPTEALKSYEASRSLGVKLCQDHPQRAGYEAELARTCNNLGVLYRQVGKTRDALASYEQARDIRRRLSNAYPDFTDYQADLAITCNNLAVLQRRLGQVEEARKSYQLAQDLYRRLNHSHPKMTRYRVEGAYTDVNLANLLRQTSRVDEALPLLNPAIAILQEESKTDPNNPRSPIQLREAHGIRAQTLRQLGRPREAVADWDVVLPLETSAAARISVRLHRAAAQALAGEYRAAHLEATSLAEAGPLSAEVLYRLAGVTSLCAAAVHRDAMRPLPDREKSVELWMRHAVELLRRAQAEGYFEQARNVKLLERDEALALLRSRDDFQRWLAGLAK